MTTTPLLATIGFLAMSGAAFAGPAGQVESWASGQIARVDAAAHTVVITQGTHEMTYQLASGAVILVGGHAQPSPNLNADIGRTVRVRYSTTGTKRIADRLEISAPAAAAAAPTAAATHTAAVKPMKPVKR